MSMTTFIKTNFDLCTGCSICQLACSMGDQNGYNPRLSHLRIEHKKENLYHKPIVCNHCQNAYCMNVCPAKAYYKNEFGAVVIDAEKCVSCGLCVKYCPESLVQISPETLKAVKCDMCQKYDSPQCVEACPTGALELAFRYNPKE
ncbi:MAG: 4Fe-4S dicluster domain-containing protein [Desulfamplus sp.]|nr:4Fe-4S dicluster domain-containing protein [Desulfamplus sp.]MBF0242013.1 4Fe-4S dicluster domain-containing protein [Desulfamplus sp.]